MLETERLFLRPLNEADIESVFALRSDEDVMRFIRAPQTKRHESEKWIRLVSSRWTDEKIGFCSIIEKSSNRFIGWCGLWRLQETGETEVGYALSKEFWGRGYAAEAAEAFLIYGFENLGLDKIVAVASPENTGSRRVMEKVGMKYDYTGNFYERDLVHYTITRDDYVEKQKAFASPNYVG